MSTVTQARREFLFINKNKASSSFSHSRSNRENHREIQQFVQKSIARRPSAVPSLASGLVGWRKKESSPPSKNGQASWAISIRTTLYNAGEEENEQTDLELLPFPRCCTPAGGAGDPFASVSITIDPAKAYVIEHFTRAWMPGDGNFTANLAGFTPVEAGDLDLGNAIVRQSLFQTSKLHAYAVLAACAGRMRKVCRIVLPTSVLPELLVIKGLHALQEHLRDGRPIDSYLLLSIYYLAYAEFFVNNFEGDGGFGKGKVSPLPDDAVVLLTSPGSQSSPS